MSIPPSSSPRGLLPTAAETAAAAPEHPKDRQNKPPRRKQKHPRKPTSCKPCRLSKLRCDRHLPCASCKRRDNTPECTYRTDQEDAAAASTSSVGPRATASTSDSSRLAAPRPTTPPREDVPRAGSPLRPRPASVHGDNQDFTRKSWESLWQRPAQQHVMSNGPIYTPFLSEPRSATENFATFLPPAESCDYLVIQYFTYTAPMFHIIHETTFQAQYSSFAREWKTDDLAWLALLFSILSLSVQTIEYDDPILVEIRGGMTPPRDNAAVASELRSIAMACLWQGNFMFQYNLTTLESLLVLTYGISHDNGVDAAWTLLGLALNMGIALKCNAPAEPRGATVDMERRRRCWAGILSLHTYQTILFRDIDTRPLLNISDAVLATDGTSSPKSSLGLRVMNFKMRIFRLSSRICHNSAAHVVLDETATDELNAEIASEQSAWDEAFLRGGAPSVLDPISYAMWCMFQAYAHQLYLLLHRPFSRVPRISDNPGASRTSQYRPSSRQKCITSGAALLNLQRQYMEMPRLRHYRWTVYGMIGSCTVHGAMALASCLLEEQDNDGLDKSLYYDSFHAAVDRIGMLQSHSTIYVKAYPILRHIQTVLQSRQEIIGADSFAAGLEEIDLRGHFDDWMSTIQWFD